MSNIPQVYDRVVRLLKEDTKYRDDDNALVARIWWDELRAKNIEGTSATATQFLTLYRDGKVTTADSITRARRKAQELHKELRGASYTNRQVHKTEEVKSAIRYMQ